jgi:hypothetical protein
MCKLQRKRDLMTEHDQADLANIELQLKSVQEELHQLETRIDANAVAQAALSTAMALAWIELLWKTEDSDG